MWITREELGQRPRQHRALPYGKGWDLAVGRGVGSDRRSARGLLTHALTLVSPGLHRDGPDSLGRKKQPAARCPQGRSLAESQLELSSQGPALRSAPEFPAPFVSAPGAPPPKPAGVHCYFSPAP